MIFHLKTPPKDPKNSILKKVIFIIDNLKVIMIFQLININKRELSGCPGRLSVQDPEHPMKSAALEKELPISNYKSI